MYQQFLLIWTSVITTDLNSNIKIDGKYLTAGFTFLLCLLVLTPVLLCLKKNQSLNIISSLYKQNSSYETV